MSGQDRVGNIMRDIFRKTVTLSLAAVVLFAVADTAYAKWEIEYSDFLINAMRRQGHSVQKRVGSYSKRAECEEARRRAVRQSGDPSLDMHMRCVGFDEPSHQTPAAPSQQHPGRTPSEDAKQRAEQERQKQEQEKAEKEKAEAFEREKEKLLKAFKGRSPAGITVPQTGTTGLPLKGSGASQPSASKPYDPAIKERTVKAIKELNCSAYWALNAAGAALKGDYETARRDGEFSAQAKGGNTVSGCPEIKVYVPDVPPPVEANPQIQLYNHIIQQAGVLAVDIAETSKKIENVKRRLENTKKDINVKQEKIKEIDRLLDHPRGKKEVLSVQKEKTEKELDELKNLAMALEKDAVQLNKNADEHQGKRSDLQGMYQFVTENPQRAEELAKKVR